MAYGSTYDNGDPTTRYDPNAPNQPEGTNGVYHDAQGRAYVVGPDGSKSYIQSYDQAQQAHDQSGFFRSYEWNPVTGQNEPRTNWGNIIGLAAAAEPGIAGGMALAGAGGAAGASSAGPTLGGGSTVAANLPASTALAGAPTGAVASGTAAGATGTAATTGGSNVLASTPITPTYVPPIAGAPGITGGAGGGFVSSLFRNLLPHTPADWARAGTNLAGNYLQSRQTSQAVAAQVQAAQEAMALQREIYQQQRSDLAPYRTIGNQATDRLSTLMGFPAVSSVAAPHSSVVQNGVPGQMAQRGPTSPPAFVPAANYTGDTAVPRSSLAGLGGAPTASSYQVQAPTGQIGTVPASQLGRALAAGGRLIQ